jgi:hypothetical protein
VPAPRRAAAALLLAALVGACGGGDDDDTAAAGSAAATTTTAAEPATTGAPGTAATEPTEATTSTAPAPEDLPPLESLTEDDVPALQAVYGPPLAALDLVVTRGGVVEYRGGTHLQLYVEPTTSEADNDAQVYLDRMLTSFQAIIPRLFDAYPEMDSFDLCQEPVPTAAEPRAEPGYEVPVTLLLLTRAGYESVDDWSTATLADLFTAADDALDGYSSVSPEVAELADYEDANPDGD